MKLSGPSFAARQPAGAPAGQPSWDDSPAKTLKGHSATGLPRNLPVDRATKFELAINLTTAKVLGLLVPDKLLVAADEVIE